MKKDLRAYIHGLTTSVTSDRGEHPFINLDNAASMPPFVSVVRAVNNFLPYYASVHRGGGLKSRISSAMYEEARQVMSDFVGANAGDHVVIFGKNTTEAINKVAYRLRLQRRDVVIISSAEHHSNDLPWRAHATVVRIALTPTGGIDTLDFERLVRKYAHRLRLVAITGASNVTGYVPDIHWFARRAHDVGAEILVDCAQLAAHQPIDMRPLSDPNHLDYVVLSAHKMYAPFGSGILVGPRDTFERGAPEYQGGGTIVSVTPKTVDWAPPPDSDEAGTPNVVGAIACAEAARTLQRIGFATITQHEEGLRRYALRRLGNIRGVRLYGDTSPDAPRVGVVSFTAADVPSRLVAAILDYEWGIGVRAGCFCAQPYVMQLLGYSRASQMRIRSRLLHGQMNQMPGMVRVSFGMYNTRHDIDILAEAIATIVLGHYGHYVTDQKTGHYIPKDFVENRQFAAVLQKNI